MANSLSRNPIAAFTFLIILLLALLFTAPSKASPSSSKLVHAFGTTPADVQTELVTSSAGNHSVLIFQTSFSILVPCTTRLIRPPRFYEPPVQTLIATPTVTGTYPVIFFKHGFNLAICFYTQLFHDLASSGYIVVAPQAVTLSSNATDEIGETAKVANWIPNGLAVVLKAAIADADVAPDMSKLIMGGHSRGGKVAFAMALGIAVQTQLPSFSALVVLDPVDGAAPDAEFPPPLVEAQCDHTRNILSIPVLILGTGYGNERAGPFGIMPPCAPECCSHAAYFNCSSSPLMYHFSALEYGHLDFLDDSVWWTSSMCVSGTSKVLLRNFSRRLIVAFLQATLEGNEEDMDYILENWEEVDSVKLDEPQIYTSDDEEEEEEEKEEEEGAFLKSTEHAKIHTS